MMLRWPLYSWTARSALLLEYIMQIRNPCISMTHALARWRDLTCLPRTPASLLGVDLQVRLMGKLLKAPLHSFGQFGDKVKCYIHVTDAATGSVRMITPLAGTVAFLRNLGLLFDSFGVHLKGQKPPAVSIRDAVSTLSNIVEFVEDCTMQVQKITRKKSPTNGPEGTISHRTQTSTVMILHGLTRL